MFVIISRVASEIVTLMVLGIKVLSGKKKDTGADTVLGISKRFSCEACGKESWQWQG